MSTLEEAIEQERLQVLALLEGRPVPQFDSTSPPITLTNTSGQKALSTSLPSSPTQAMMVDSVNRHRQNLPTRNPFSVPPKKSPTAHNRKGMAGGFFGSTGSASTSTYGTNDYERGRRSGSSFFRPRIQSQSPRMQHLQPNPDKGFPPNFARGSSSGKKIVRGLATQDPNIYITESGGTVDLRASHRLLTDDAFMRSGSSQSKTHQRRASDPARVKIMLSEETETSKRGPDSMKKSVQGANAENSGLGSMSGRHEKDIGKNALARAENQRENTTTHTYRSLIEPNVASITLERSKLSSASMIQKKTAVHPHTNFDAGPLTPADSEAEESISEIRRAQRLEMRLSRIITTPASPRAVRQIVRGDYATYELKAEKGLVRERVYLVSTDLSDEAAFALEWTIGTVLRDGDTLLAVYAVDEESGTGEYVGVDGGKGFGIGEGARLTLEVSGLIKLLSKEPSTLDRESIKGKQIDESLANLASMGKAERERYDAVEKVSERCVKLLRKTRLQVRVIVEVFHCKSPKHTITEVIDALAPTLVILGSRGRSALKGVLLGSFSNYLVSKSSVPVMVARKRLQKHSKYKRINPRMTNMLSNPSVRLANAKID